MPPTRLKSQIIGDGDILREDINTTTAGKALITKLLNGGDFSLASTGIDSGTGDVTLSLATTGITAGEYAVTTLDNKGRATGGRALAVSDLPVAGIGTGTGIKFTYDNYGRITAVGSLAAGDIPSGSTFYVQNQSGSAQTANAWVTGFMGANVLRAYEGTATYFVAVAAPAGLAADRTFTLPSVYGGNGDVLVGDGAGVLSWTNLSSTYVPVAGATTVTGLKTFSAGVISNGTTTVSAFAHVGAGSVSATRLVLTSAASTDTVARFSIMEDGRLEWGSGGASARDTYLVRETGGGFRTASKIQISSSALSIAGMFLVNGGSITSAVNGVYRLLLHFEGANGSRKFQDSASYSAPVYTRGANYYSVPTISTAQKKFGASSMLLDGSSFLEVGFLYAIGTGDFSLDFHVRFTSVAGTQTLVDVGGTAGLRLSYSAGTWTAVVAGTTCTFTQTPSANTWYHIALSRTSNSVRFFVDGTKTGTTQTASGSMTTGTANAFIGATSAGADRTSAYIDEFRFITSWSSYQSDSNISVATAAYDPFGYRVTTGDTVAQAHEGKVLTGDAAGNFSPQRPARSVALVFALPENVANTSKYFYARRGPGGTQEDAQRSGNSSGLSFANSCSPEFSPVNGRITSAVLVVQGVGVNNGSVTYPVVYRADLFRVGFGAEHDPNINAGAAAQLNFSIGAGVGLYSIGSTNTRIVLQDLNIPVLAGDPISLKFVNGTGASGAAIVQMSFVTLTIEETF